MSPARLFPPAAWPLRTLLACLLMLALLLQSQAAHARWVCEAMTAPRDAAVQLHDAASGALPPAAVPDCHETVTGAPAPDDGDAGDDAGAPDDGCRVSPACCHAVAPPSSLPVVALPGQPQPAPEAVAALRLEPRPSGFDRPPRRG